MKIAVIPARGGSKRIPRKNIKLFCGKPMIAWAISTAFQSGCFDEVIVSTDDAEIADVATAYGAKVPFVRPSELSDDLTGTLSVVAHAVEWYSQQGETPTFMCCLYPTTPLLQPESLSAAYELIVRTQSQFCLGVAAYGHPMQRALRVDDAGHASMFFPEHALTRSQDLEAAFHDAGQFCWGTATAFREGISPMLKKSAAFVLPRTRVVDIDTQEDWELAEALYMALHAKHSE